MDESKRVRQLLVWREEAASEFRRAKAAVADAQRRLEESRERLRLLDRLLVVEGVSAAPLEEDVGTPNGSDPVHDGDELLDACERIVREVGRPLHISELHTVLLKQGIPVPGRGTQANLLVRLHRSNGRFVRTGRGTYAPASLGAAEVRPTVRRRVVRKAK